MDISITNLDAFILKFIENEMPVFSIISKYRESVKVNEFCEKINYNVINSIENSVIFVSDKPNYTFLRQSISLRKQHVKTILLTRWGVQKEERQFYDQVILYDKIEDLKLLAQCEGCKFYIHTWIWWSFMAVYIDLIVDGDIYCNINDLVSMDPKDSINFYSNKYGKEYVDMGILCEEYILDKFPIVTLQNYSESILEQGYIGDYRIKHNNLLPFPCYPSPFFMQKGKRKLTKNIELLYLGGITPDKFPNAGFAAGKFHQVIAELLHSGLHLSFFLNPGALNSAIVDESPRVLDEQYPVLTNMAALNDRFTLQKGYFPWELSEHSKKFHFGLMIYYFSDSEINSPITKNALPSKLFTYLEIGLPVIVMKEALAMSDFVRHTGVGIVISKNEISNLHNIIDQHKNEYPIYIENIRKYCSENNMDKMIQTIFPRLN